MARMIHTAPRAARPAAAKGWQVSAEARQHMIAEAAYYRYMRHGAADGHDLDDWLAAEAAFERASHGEPPLPEEAAAPEFEIQQSGGFGPAEDDVLKRSLKAHSRRDIPRVESVEPEMAPPKE